MSLAGWLERALGVENSAPKPPTNFTPRLPDNDDQHASEEHYEESDLVGQSFILEYKDAAGAVSERRITVRGLTVTSEGHLCVTAMCWERKAIRSFRADRMLSLARISTGEVIPNLQQFLLSYAGGIMSSDSTAVVLKAARPGVRALLFLARCDGRVHPLEIDVIRAYVDQIAADRVYDWNAVLEFVKHQQPDKSLAKTSLKCMWYQTDEAGRLLTACESLARADGIIVDAEVAGIDRIRHLVEEPCQFESEFARLQQRMN